jgi:hypothetical protein
MSSNTKVDKVLVVLPGEDQESAFTKYNLDYVNTSSLVVKKTTFASFQDGKRVDKFDFVLFYAPEFTADEIEMQDELFKHYSIAPVTGWMVDQSAADFIKENHGDNCIIL